MRTLVTGLVINAVFAAGLAAAMPPALTIDQLLDICRSPTVAEAAATGDRLGWPRMNAARLEEWRAGFVSHIGSPVQVVGWQRGADRGADAVSFWTAHGPGGHRACAYSTAEPAGLLDALSARFGTPASLDRHDFGTMASWNPGRAEVSFAQIGSTAVVNIRGHE
ncbi:hypothetical protein [Plastoroseomonas hellenica]|uniref:hypothetical protein n=1 Tax=Plastoroseomonas hellenica TaxID=2687306 RepID=UPI001BAAAA89|nr:hypothetical protein [Plastoroseomonas hellenica]MBR0644382.1 hypothetical protein [Plastoroseomonas hellenica]